VTASKNYYRSWEVSRPTAHRTNSAISPDLPICVKLLASITLAFVALLFSPRSGDGDGVNTPNCNPILTAKETLLTMTAKLLSVQSGKIAPLGPNKVLSGFVKISHDGPVKIGPLGLEGDEQADPKVHGGPEKAVYAYAASNYVAWQIEYPALQTLFVPGGLGENLTIDGMSETTIHVGDIHAIGSALLQVCQPRQPCFKLALRFGNKHLPKAMVQNGRSGWYYRVLQPGTIGAGDDIFLREQPNPDFAFSRLVAIVNHGNATMDEITRMANMPGLASKWQSLARATLDGLGPTSGAGALP